MNKKPLIIVSVLVLLIIAALVIFGVKKPMATTTEVVKDVVKASPIIAPLVPAIQTEEYKGTTKALMATGKAQACTFTEDQETRTVDGKMYITTDGKMRGDFTETGKKNNNKTIQHIVIKDTTNVYVWSDLQTKGLKVALTSKYVTAPSEGSPDINKEMDFQCQPWTVDASMLETPKDMVFISL
jgi:hypothetical protein